MTQQVRVHVRRLVLRGTDPQGTPNTPRYWRISWPVRGPISGPAAVGVPQFGCVWGQVAASSR